MVRSKTEYHRKRFLFFLEKDLNSKQSLLEELHITLNKNTTSGQRIKE